ncbi:MAG: bifunctional alpha/beta hydrolase/OsmC family protein [Sphingomonas sp.]|uniref:bifunctional alpha/beta hydrolase/OsmC family protein n=1 Tax=Sphingomonas sp. TaxID=28214 RepID=UPI0025ED3604|nr:bifunctional alpha/beta hydrolase/OsmC family protein [Sphingomonas sp.]MBX9882906.1 bifunctional alpha/beta hydrolase/OsmC family protein [Sphingomonas sp.]
MRRDVEFTNAQGTRLAGRLELPPGRVRAVALFAHCFTCTSASHGARRIGMALAEHGIATLAFDFTGLGKSGGSFVDSHFAANVQDLVAAADFLRGDIGAPAVLIGHSLGGAAVIAAAEHIPEATAVVTIGAPFDPAHVLHQLGDQIAAVRAQGQAEVTIGGRPFQVSDAFLHAVEGQDQAARLARLKRALLVLHAPTDATVGLENAGEIFAAAKHPKSFVSLDGADHLLTQPAPAAYAAAMIATWVEPYLPPAVAADAPEEGRVRVTTTDAKFTSIVESSGHSFLADEPLRVGGANLGPTPYDLLLSALGTCTAMTIKLVADREAIPLKGVSIELQHQRCHSEDCAETGEGKPKIDVLTRDITLVGALSDTQRARLLGIADRCPVHRTLENHPVIKTRLVE